MILVLLLMVWLRRSAVMKTGADDGGSDQNEILHDLGMLEFHAAAGVEAVDIVHRVSGSGKMMMPKHALPTIL